MKRLHETETSPVAYDTAPKKIRSALKQELKIIIIKKRYSRRYFLAGCPTALFPGKMQALFFALYL